MKLGYTRFCEPDNHFSFSSKLNFISLFVTLILEKQKQKEKEKPLNIFVLCNTTHITHKPSWRSAALVMPIFKGSFNSECMWFFSKQLFLQFLFRTFVSRYLIMLRCGSARSVGNFTLFNVVCRTLNLFFEQSGIFS